MYDTVLGLPLHVLLLHATVVLVPLAALGTAAVFGRPRWRRSSGGAAVGVNLAMLALTFVTVQAGQELQNRFRGIGDNEVPRDDHEAFGRALLWVVLALALTTSLAWLLTRSDRAPAAVGVGAGVLVAGLAVAAIVLTVLAGHTGSKSHWEDFVDNTDTAGVDAATG